MRRALLTALLAALATAALGVGPTSASAEVVAFYQGKTLLEKGSIIHGYSSNTYFPTGLGNLKCPAAEFDVEVEENGANPALVGMVGYVEFPYPCVTEGGNNKLIVTKESFEVGGTDGHVEFFADKTVDFTSQFAFNFLNTNCYGVSFKEPAKWIGGINGSYPAELSLYQLYSAGGCGSIRLVGNFILTRNGKAVQIYVK